jgi:bifunctional DNA-binding transcriptional regulator/antitoxin component of YhaV-PrlF toxin-antitoxin module
MAECKPETRSFRPLLAIANCDVLRIGGAGITVSAVTATVTEQMQVALPLEICAALGIEPGVELDFRVREGKIEAVKVSSESKASATFALGATYIPERDTEELIIQSGCSCEVPEDFPR